MVKKDYCDFLDFPIRQKPRDEGIISMADFYYSTKEIESFLEVLAEYIDFAKFIHIGLEKPLPKGWLEKKLNIYKDSNVKTYPGGIPFQVATVQKKVPAYFDWLVLHGFDGVEISDDALVYNIEPTKWDDMIKMALDKGLIVITELGKKNPEEPLNLEEAYERIQQELELGVTYCTIERSELDVYLKGDASPLQNLIKKAGLKHILFEPGPYGFPHIHRWLLRIFGPNVNMGNIDKDEVISLEYARKGFGRLGDPSVDFSYFFDKTQ